MISTNQTYLVHSRGGCKPLLIRGVRLMLRVAGSIGTKTLEGSCRSDGKAREEQAVAGSYSCVTAHGQMITCKGTQRYLLERVVV